MKKTNDNDKKTLIVLICLFALTSFFSIVTFSRFSETLSDSGETAIAKWKVSIEDNDEKDISIVSGNGSSTFIVGVKSESEVASSYSIVLSNIPDGVIVTLDGVNEKGPTVGIVTFENIGTITAVDNQVHEHSLSFTADIDAVEVDNQQIKLDVLFTQVEL